MGSATSGVRKIVALDLLRFACASLVVAYHFGSAYARSPSVTTKHAFAGLPPIRLFEGTWFGWIGVELFFVISGYVIAISARDITARAFLRRRVLRLAPGAWVCASISAAIFLVAGLFSPLIVFALWLNSVLFNPWLPQIDGSYWTLGIEVDFYILVAICMRIGGTAAVEALPNALGVVSAAFWLTLLMSGADIGAVPSVTQNLLLLPHGCFFAVGMFLERGSRNRLARAYPIFVLALLTCAVEIFGHTVERTRAMALPFQFALPLGLFVTGLLIVAIAHRFTIGGRTARFATILGLATYPLYLLHQDAGAVTVAALIRCGIGLPAALAVAAAAMLAIALLCAQFAEPYVRRMLVATIEAARPSRFGISFRPVRSVP